MKKNFAKKLATVLSLTLVASLVVPAVPASAATAPDLAKRRTYVYEGNEYSYTAKNATGYTIKWSVSGEGAEFVDLSATKGKETVLTVATEGNVAAKLAPVTVKAKFYKKDKLVKTRTDNVNIKVSAKEVVLSNKGDVTTAKVGETVDFDSALTPTNATSNTYFTVTDKADVAVAATDATIDADGNFVATKAGDYKVVATVSNAKGSAVLDTESKEIKVVNYIESVKQVDLDTVNVTFAAPITDKNLTVSTLVGTTKVKQVVKEVKMDETNKVATVTLYVPFNTGATYAIDYADLESAQFVAAKTDATEVNTASVVTTEAVVGTPKDIEVKLFNKDGVDITTAALLSRVTFASSSEKTFLSGKALTIFTKGDTTTVTATFHAYKYDTTTGAEIGNVVASNVVTGVDAATTSVSGIDAYTIENDGTPNFSDAKHSIAAEDSNYRLYVKLKKTDGTNNTYSESNAPAEVAKFSFTSSNTGVLIVDNFGNLYPAKDGTAVVVVKYDDKVVDAISITVNAKRAATNFTLDTYAFGLSNSASVADTKTVTLKVTDQLGADVTLANVSIQPLSGSPASILTGPVAANASTITFNGATATAGTYTYKVNANGLSKILTVTVNAPSSATASYYKVQLSSTALDTVVKAGDTDKNLTVELFGYASNGVKTTKEALSGAGFRVAIDAPNDANDTNATTGTYAVTAAVSGSAITKIDKGTYKVTAYKTVNNVEVAVDVTYFTVTDTQVAPVLAETKNVVSTSTNLLQAIKDCFKITLNGTDVTNSIILGDTIGSGTNVYVKNVKYREQIGTSYVEHTVNIGVTITKAQ